MNSVTNVLKQHRIFLMGCAMLSIILYHQPWCKFGVFKFFDLTGELGVEVFLFVSGWGIYHSLCKNNLRKYFKNRLLRLMPTCVFIGVIQVLIEQTGFIGGSSNPIAHLMMCLGLFKWYIYAIIVYYFVAPLLYRFLTNWKRMMIVSLFVLSIIIYCKYIRFLDDASSVFLTTLPIIIYRFPAFLLGFWFARRPFSMNVYSLAAGLIAYVVVLLLAYGVIETSFDSVLSFILFAFAVPTFVFLSKGVIIRLSKTVVYKAIVWVGGCSLEMYLWHDFFFRGFSSGIIAENVWLQIIASLMLTFGLVWITQKCTKILLNKLTDYKHDT